MKITKRRKEVFEASCKLCGMTMHSFYKKQLIQWMDRHIESKHKKEVE